MKKETKQQLTNKINEYIKNSGYTFRFSKTGDLNNNTNGICNPIKKEIIVKSTAHAKTVAHEIAHIIQFNTIGKSDCWSNPSDNVLAAEHEEYENNVYYTLRQIGLAQEWNKAAGWYPY